MFSTTINVLFFPNEKFSVSEFCIFGSLGPKNHFQYSCTQIYWSCFVNNDSCLGRMSKMFAASFVCFCFFFSFLLFFVLCHYFLQFVILAMFLLRSCNFSILAWTVFKYTLDTFNRPKILKFPPSSCRCRCRYCCYCCLLLLRLCPISSIPLLCAPIFFFSLFFFSVLFRAVCRSAHGSLL